MRKFRIVMLLCVLLLTACSTPTNNLIPFYSNSPSANITEDIPDLNFQGSSTLRVGGDGDYSTIQSAIDDAKNGDTIILARGIYRENVVITQGINFQGGWSKDFSSRSFDNALTVIDGQQLSSVISIQINSGADNNIKIECLTITNGKADYGGGINYFVGGEKTSSVFTLQDCTISDNESFIDGGGIWASVTGTGSIEKIYLFDSSIYSNRSREGGGIAAMAVGDGYLLINADNNTISSNIASEFAAGIWLNSNGTCSKMEADFSDNEISFNSGPSLDGGAMAAYASDADANTTVYLNNNTIINNSAGYGGGLFFYSWGAHSCIDITLKQNIIAMNKALNSFGGVGFYSAGNAIGNLQMENNTITENSAGDASGGVLIVAGGGGHQEIPTETDCSVVTVSSVNDIIWGNVPAGKTCDISLHSYLSNAPISMQASFSLIGEISNFQSNYSVDNVRNFDPKFDTLGNRLYYLQVDSPAIDAGSPEEKYYDHSIPPGQGTRIADLGAYGGAGNDKWS